MSALDKMVSEIKSLAAPLQDLILHEAMVDREYAEKAAEELAALRAENERLKVGKEASEKLLKEADLLFNQEMELCDDANSDEWLWKRKVRYYFEETEIPPHQLPDDMRGEA